MTKEVCDLCKKGTPIYRFKVKISKKGYLEKSSYGIAWVDLWTPYRKIVICEECAEKLFAIKSGYTRLMELVPEVTAKNEK